MPRAALPATVLKSINKHRVPDTRSRRRNSRSVEWNRSCRFSNLSVLSMSILLLTRQFGQPRKFQPTRDRCSRNSSKPRVATTAHTTVQTRSNGHPCTFAVTESGKFSWANGSVIQEDYGCRGALRRNRANRVACTPDN